MSLGDWINFAADLILIAMLLLTGITYKQIRRRARETEGRLIRMATDLTNSTLELNALVKKATEDYERTYQEIIDKYALHEYSDPVEPPDDEWGPNDPGWNP